MDRLTVRIRGNVHGAEGRSAEKLTGRYHRGCFEATALVEKLAEYEDFEEIFRSKMTDAACDFLKDKEEFAKWLDRNKWIAKKCDEYARAEEQGKLLKLPCKLGDNVFYLTGVNNAGGPSAQYITEICESKIKGFVIDGDGVAIRLDYNWKGNHGTYGFLGKTVFLAREEAEAALKEL